MIRDLHEQHEQPTKYQLFLFKTRFKFILQNRLGIYETCMHLLSGIFFLVKSYKDSRARRLIFLAKKVSQRG